MKYLLDTNICIYYLKAIHESIKINLLKKSPDDIKIPSIVKAELLYGAEKSKKREENLRKIHDFLFPFEILVFGDKESEVYAKIRSGLEKEGQVLGPNDLLIASIVLANNGILVTNNMKEFKRIKELKIENWVK